MRRALFLAAVTGTFLVAAFSCFDHSSDSPETRPGPLVDDAPAEPFLPVTPMAVAQTEAAKPEIAVRPVPSAPAEPASPTQEELFPFRFLGRDGEGPNSEVILFGNGRILKVLAPGPLDDDYAVDEIGDHYIVLRHVRLNVSKTLEFTAPRKTAPPGVPQLKDYPQD
jgi:hypothetical protein